MPSCGFEAYRDVFGKLNIRKRALKTLGIKINPGGVLPPPPNYRCSPEEIGGTNDLPVRGWKTSPSGRGGGQNTS